MGESKVSDSRRLTSIPHSDDDGSMARFASDDEVKVLSRRCS